MLTQMVFSCWSKLHTTIRNVTVKNVGSGVIGLHSGVVASELAQDLKLFWLELTPLHAFTNISSLSI